MKNTLSLIRQKRGHGGIRKFIEQEIGVKYRTFVYQIEKGTTPYKTIRLLMDKLGLKFEEFKDFDFSDNHSQEPAAVREQRVKKIKAKKAIEELDIPQPRKLSSIFGKKI